MMSLRRYDLIYMPARTSRDDMKLMIHQFYPDVALQINRSLAALNLCYTLTGGIMFEIESFGRIVAPENLQQRIRAYCADYQRRFSPSLHENYFTDRHGTLAKRKKDVILALGSAILGRTFSINNNIAFDENFFCREEDSNNNKIYRIEFLTPLAAKCILPMYAEQSILKNNKLLPAIDDNDLSDVLKDWLVQSYVISRLEACKELSKPYEITAHSYPDSSTRLIFSKYEIVYFDAIPSLKHASNDKNCLLLPAKFDHSAFGFYYFEHKKNVLFCVEITVRHDMEARIDDLHSKFEEVLPHLKTSFAPDVDFYVFVISMEAFSKHLISPDQPLNWVFLESMVSEDDTLVSGDKFADAIKALVQQNKQGE